MLTAHSARWSLWPFSVITVFTVVSDVTAVDSGSKLKVSGTSLGLMLAVVMLGGGPAAVIALLTLFVSWVCRPSRGARHELRNDAVVFAWFLLITGFFFRAAVDLTNVGPHDPGLLPVDVRRFRPGACPQLRRDRGL